MSLEVIEVFSGYGKIDILQGISIKAERIKITSIIGPNGAGKSTLLKTVCGYLKPRRGKIVFDGEDITNMKPYKIIEKGIGYVFQRRSVFPRMTTQENLELGAWLIKGQSEKVKEAVEDVYRIFPELDEKRKTKAQELSGGMQRMLEIARALISRPKLVLVDEPSAGLAPKVAKEIYEKLEMLREEEKTVVLVDQNIREALRLADYVYVLEMGRNKFEGPKEKFESDLRSLVRTWIYL